MTTERTAADRPPGHAEMIDGALFARQPATTLLHEGIDAVAAVLRKALPNGAVVDVGRPLTVSERTQLWPDLSIWRDRDQQVPDVVIEMRTESTVRFALGPKRLVYARAGVPEYYFLDPQAGILRKMVTGPEELDYGWPVVAMRRGESVELTAFPGVRLEVTDLLPLALSRDEAHDTDV